MAENEEEKIKALSNTHILKQYGGSYYLPLTRYLKHAGTEVKPKMPIEITVVKSFVIITEKKLKPEQIDILKKL